MTAKDRFSVGDYVRLVDKTGCSKRHPIDWGSYGSVVGYSVYHPSMVLVMFECYSFAINVTASRLLRVSILDRLSDV